jgi:hypothetical protein
LYILRRLFQAAGLGGQSQSTGVLITIVESGAVYSTTTVLLLVLGVAQNIACFAIIGAATQLSVSLSCLLKFVRNMPCLTRAPRSSHLT